MLGLQNRPMVEEVGFARVLDAAGARTLVDKEAAGRFGIGKQEVVMSADAWIPVAVVPLTLMELGIVRRKTATTQQWNVYDLIGGTFVTAVDTEPERHPVPIDGALLPALQQLVEPARALDAVEAKWERVTSDDTKTKYRAQLTKLGVPEWHVPTTGTPAPFLYPLHLAIAKQKASERVIAVDSYRSRIDADLGHELSKSIASVRELIAT